MKRAAAIVLALTVIPIASQTAFAIVDTTHTAEFLAGMKACDKKYGHCSYIDSRRKWVPFCEDAKVKGCATLSTKPHLKHGLPYY